MTMRWPMTGRTDEFDAITQTLNTPSTQGVLIAGDAGVGKTRLVDEALAVIVASGWLVHRITASASGRSTPLGAFTEWTGGAECGAVHAPLDVIPMIAAAARTEPVLLGVDDAHLLDDASAFVVHQLLQRGLAKAVVTVRAGDPAPDGVLTLWKDGLLSRLDLRPLARQDYDDLLEAALGAPVTDDCAGRLWELTRGNLSWLTHLVSQERSNGGMVEDRGRWHWPTELTVSPALSDLVEMQFGSLSEPLKEVVDLVAVVGSINRCYLNTLTDLEAAAEAERRGLIATDALLDTVRLTYPLYAGVRLAQCGPLRRRRLRGRLATAMTRPGNTEPVDPVQLGALWLESDLAPDPEVLLGAAECAINRLDVELAERCGRAAIDAGGGVKAKVRYAYALFLMGRGDEAESILAAIHPGELSGADFINDLNLTAMNVFFSLARPEDAMRLVERALGDSSGSRAHQLNTLRGLQLAFTADPTGAMDALETVDHRQLDEFGSVTCLGIRTLAFGERGQTGRAHHAATQAWQVIDVSQDSFHVANMAKIHTDVLVQAGRIDDAIRVAEAADSRCADMAPISRRLSSGILGAVALANGDLRTAVLRLHPASLDLDRFGGITGHSYRFQIFYTIAIARSGDAENAIVALEAARGLRRPGYSYVESVFLLAEAWVAAVQGQPNTASRMAIRAAEFARQHGQLAREVVCLQASVEFGNTTAAARLVELAGLVEGPRALIAARYAGALSRRDAVELDSVSRDFETMGDLQAAAAAAGQAAAAHQSASRQSSALTAAGRAMTLGQTCGGVASPALRAASGITSPFTDRQREIALLISQGLTNREIAEALSLSVRTVEGHIYRASFRAELNNRGELAGLILASPAPQTRCPDE